MPIDRSGPKLGNLEGGARAVARLIDEMLQDHADERVGFTLFVFEFGVGGWTTYISNAPRDDMRRVVEEWLEREGGAVHDDDCPRAQQCMCG